MLVKPSGIDRLRELLQDMVSYNWFIRNNNKDNRYHLIGIIGVLYEHGRRFGGFIGTRSIDLSGSSDQFGTNKSFGRLGGA